MVQLPFPQLPEQGVRPVSDAPRDLDSQDVSDDLARLHALLGHSARQLWDVQKQRIGAGNHLAALERDGFGGLDLLAAQAAVEQYEGIEKGFERQLMILIRRHFMRDWIEAQRGIGLPGFARLLGVTGDIGRFPTASKLWKYLGLHVVDGHAPKREKGVPWTHTDCTFNHLTTCKPDCTTDHHPNCLPGGVGTAYAPQGRVVSHQLGEAIVKVGGDGPYRRAYDEKKAYYEAERPDWTQLRRHNAAMRYAVKELIRELWREWHRRRGHTISEGPYGGVPGNPTHYQCSCTPEARGHAPADTHSRDAAPDVATRAPLPV
jgi:hypothetical protein